MKRNIPIGQLLINNGDITENQLQRALEIQKKTSGKRLGDILIDLSYVTEKKMLESLSERVNAPLVELDKYIINPEASKLIKSSFAQKHNIIPIDFKNNMLVVATNDPLDFYIFDQIKAITGYEISIVLAEKNKIEHTINKVYSQETVKTVVEDVNKEYDEGISDSDVSIVDERIGNTPVVKLVNTIIKQAYQKNASDIHIEPFEKNLVVRIRVNGDLIHHTTMNIAAHTPITTRLKILAGMNIADKRIPQDGKFNFGATDINVDVRVSSIPTIHGEKLVLRLMGQGNKSELMSLENLGLSKVQLEQFDRMLKVPNGIILVTGPTGSGKTTTLYATINKLARKKINIITVEDPVEKPIESVNQVQVNNKAGLTFVTALRSILRQDPDVIMIGEMRDSETANIGVRASITGHLVLSTIHTNDAISSITRLLDMGIAPYMVSASLSGIIAQRLVKRLCPNCKQEYTLDENEKQFFKEHNIDTLYKADGCQLCNYTGYIGRKAIYEVVSIDNKLRSMITNGATQDDMYLYKKTDGTEFLKDIALKLAVDGETSFEEVEKIIYSIE